MRITINDEIADKVLQAMPTHGLIDPTAERILERGLDLLDPAAFVINKDEASQLAYVLNGIPVSTGKGLITQVQNLADIKIGQIRLKLHPSVLAGLKDRANREGKPLSEVMQWAIGEIEQNLARFA